MAAAAVGAILLAIGLTAGYHPGKSANVSANNVKQMTASSDEGAVAAADLANLRQVPAPGTDAAIELQGSDDTPGRLCTLQT